MTVTGAGSRPTLEVERTLWRGGHRWVAGIDEVGRGAWAGPLSVGIAIVHTRARTRSIPRWLRDSKMLEEQRRESVYGEVASWCADAAVGHASAAECDLYGMTMAWRLAAHRALASLELVPDAVVIDGPWDLLRGPARLMEAAAPTGDATGAVSPREQPHPEERARPEPILPEVLVPTTVLPVVDGDARCAAVAAASVLAKVVRDRLMRAEAVNFPAYGFERNKGYPTPIHKMALRGYGLSAIHRRSWAYVADLPWGCGPAGP